MTEEVPSESIPPVPVPEKTDDIALSDAQLIEYDGRRLDHRLRRFAGYGALVVAAILYLAGLCAVYRFMRIVVENPAASANMWHVVVATLVALFSVPTFLVFAVLRHAKPSTSIGSDAMLHSAIGEKLLAVLERWVK